MTLKEQLADGEKIFSRIDSLVKNNQSELAYELIQTENPPASWVIELDSLVKKGEKFKTIKLELMEAVVRRIFGKCEITKIEPILVNQDKAGTATVTVVARVETSYLGNAKNYPMVLAGVATEVVTNIRLLPLATPKASSMAVKNAIKQLGRLFGKYLNNEAEEIELPIEPLEKKITPEEEREAVTEGILLSKTKEDLKSWRSLVFSKNGTAEQQSLYESKMRQFN